MLEVVNIKNALAGRTVDPALTNSWICTVLPEIPLGNRLDPRYVENVTLNRTYFDVGGVFGYGTKAYYAGSTDVNGCSVTLYEDNFFTTQKWVTAWKNEVQDSDGYMGLPEDGPNGLGYKGEFIFLLLDRLANPVVRATIAGSWIVSDNSLDLNYDQAQAIKYQLTLSNDSVNYEFLSV